MVREIGSKNRRWKHICATCRSVFELGRSKIRKSPRCGRCIRKEIMQRFHERRAEEYSSVEYQASKRSFRLEQRCKRHGITLEEFEQIKNMQGNVCAICQRMIDTLVIDHDHDSGDVRGLLCQSCNRAIGVFKDNPGLLIRAASYLSYHFGSRKGWDGYFLDLAEVVASKSKDPSSKIGAVLVREDKTVLSTGYNGFPRGVDDNIPGRYERSTKHRLTVHAEINAILSAAGQPTKGSTLYLVGFGPPTIPCTECAKAVIQAGVAMVIGRPFKAPSEDWADDLSFSRALLTEAGVKLEEVG